MNLSIKNKEEFLVLWEEWIHLLNRLIINHRILIRQLERELRDRQQFKILLKIFNLIQRLVELRCSNKIIKILEGKVKNNLIHKLLKIQVIPLDLHHQEGDLEVHQELDQVLEDVVLKGSLQLTDLSHQLIQNKWFLLPSLCLVKMKT